jgi:DNA-binding transcriptional LysR family regulator
MEDFRLKIFMTLAEEGSFTKAAAALGISQPAVSQNISELEKTTGVRLFERLKGEIVLTEQGKVFKEYAERILNAYSEASMMFAPLPSTTVKISASEEIHAYLVAPTLEKFTKVHPEITFERVLFEDADLAIHMAPSPDNPFDIYADSIAKIRISMSPAPKKMGDFTATHEKTSYFDVLFKPSATFACTKVCRVLKDYFASLL